MRTFRSFALAATFVALLTACQSGGTKPPLSGRPTTSPATASPGANTAAESTPSPPVPWVASGVASSTCKSGWKRPPKNSPRFHEAIDLIRRMTGIGGRLVVMDMRYFVGPESPPSIQNYLAVVQRWYVKLYSHADPSYRARFVVESRRFGSGVVAVAPFDSEGFRSPDWRGFQYDSGNPAPRVYPGLPGEWSGIEYDFVNGGAGLTIPGLPRAVAGCLDGT